MIKICKHCAKEYEWYEGMPNWKRGNVLGNGYGSISSDKFCSYDCGREYQENKKKETNLKIYGVENVSKNKVIANKISQIKIEKNKDEQYKRNTIQKQKKTTLLNHGDENFRNIDKAKQTYISHYGVDNNMKSEKGLANHKNAIKDKYNVDNVFQLDSIKNLSKQTRKEKYGKEYYSKTTEWKQRVYNTKKEHNSFNQSKEEDLIYTLLLCKFKNVIRQYNSELYPFDCDFYLPEKDIYIEYQGSWTHGTHPYTNNEEDINMVNLWSNKHSKFYDNAINVWTKRDVVKRNTAKQNGITLLEFFTLKDFQDWYNSVC